MCAEHEEEDVVVVWREPEKEGKGKKSLLKLVSRYENSHAPCS